MKLKKRKMIVWHEIVPILLMLLLVVLICPVTISAEEKETVRVGVYPLERFHAFGADGVCKGYDVDYLTKIAGYTGWNYEYVEADSWAHAIDMLRNNEIDVLSPSQVTTDRLSEFSFSTFPVGKVYAAILTLNNSEVIYEDYDAFASMSFGIEEGNTYTKIFQDYALLHKFEPNIQYYQNHEMLVKALHDGEVDAIVANVMRAESDMKLLGKAGTAQYYYMYRKDDLKLGEQLNYAIDQIEIADPTFQQQLIDNYFPIYNEDPFTKEELDYIAQLPIMKVGLIDDSRPISYTDPQTGEFTGIAVDILKKISQNSGLKFEYVAIDRQHNTMQDFVENGLDIRAGVRSNPHNRLKYNGSLSISYLDTQAVLVGKSGVLPQGKLNVAVPNCSNNLKEILTEMNPEYHYAYYDSVEEAFQAVTNDESDCVLENQYTVNYMLQKPEFEDLKAIPNSGYSDLFSMMWIGNDSDPDINSGLLMSIINKSIRSLGDDDIQQSIIMFTTAMPYHLSIGEVCYKYRMPFSIIAVLVLLILTMGAVFIIDRSHKLVLISNTNQELASKNVQLADAVQQANLANHSKSDFLARMSHEIRTPMNAIIGETTIAQKSISSQEKVSECLNKVMISSKHLLNLINDILDMSAIESNKIKLAHVRFDLKNVVDTVTTLYYSQCNAKKINFESKLDNIKYEWLIGDQLRLQQIILNLLSNAFKFTEPGGNIDFMMNEEETEIGINLHITVKDTGCGMTEEFKERIFSPFEQGNPLTAKEHGGSGLGLSITKNFAELMGGKIIVNSQLGVGTTFEVTVPYEVSEEQIFVQQNTMPEMNAIIIDDDPDALEYAGDILEHMGVKYDCAESGEVALNIITKARNDKKMYDLCLIDWRMNGITGVELTKRIRSACGETPIVVVASAYDLNEIREEADRAGVDICISKPLFQSTVFNILMDLSKGRLVKNTAQPANYDFTGKHLLIVDDTDINREIAVELLKMVGFDVDTAVNGKEGLEQFEKSAPGTYDAILMDVQMPVMNGYEAAKAIRKSGHPEAKSILIIAMTANAFAEDIAESLSSGMNDHLSKPIDTDVMYQVLNRYLNQ